MDEHEEPDWKVHYDNLAVRMSNIERAFFGFLDPDTNEFRSGLLQNSADAARSIERSALEIKDVKRWLKYGVYAMVALLLAIAFPKLWALITQVMKVAG